MGGMTLPGFDPGLLASMLPIFSVIAGATGTPSSSTTTSGGTGTSATTASSTSATQSQQQVANQFANAFNELMSGTGTGQVTPTLSPESAAFMNQLIQRYTAQTTPSLTGYAAGQTAQINANAALQNQAVNNIMASRGLATSPVAATAAAGVEQNRANQITSMQQQLPLLQNQLNLQNLGAASQFFSTLPRGQTTATTTQQAGSGGQGGWNTGTTQATSGTVAGSTSNTTSSQTGRSSTAGSQGGGIGGAAAGLITGAMIQNWLNNQANQGGGFGGGFPSNIGTFGSDVRGWFSDKRLKKDIKDIPQNKAIEKIRELRSREWIWKGGSRGDSGFLAQEVEKILPDLVEEPLAKEGKDFKAINYAGLIPYLVGAVQDLDKRVGA